VGILHCNRNNRDLRVIDGTAGANKLANSAY
jgi:hypothetical protein